MATVTGQGLAEQHAGKLDAVSLGLRHQVHDVGYFGPGTFEQFSVADTD